MKTLDAVAIGLVVTALAGCGDDGDGDTAGSASASGTATESGTDTTSGSETVTASNTATQGSAEGTSGSTDPSTSTMGPTTEPPTTSTGTDTAATDTNATDDTTAGTTGATDGTTGTGGSSGSDGSGSSTGGGVVDTDMDGIPDPDDPFPEDPNLPGVVIPNTVYAHTSGTLYTMDVNAPYTVTEIGAFTFPMGSGGSVTDIAIDRWGVLYAITFNDLHVCNPADAACYYLADLPSTSNGLTFVPPGTLDLSDDALIGIANNGDWRHLELMGGVVNQMVLGSYGAGYSSSGDAFSIDGVGTFASVNAAGQASDVIVEVDPTEGTVILEVGVLTGYTSVYGLAGWAGSIFAFDASGDVLLVDPETGAFEVINETTQTWWGAAVSTVLPQ